MVDKKSTKGKKKQEVLHASGKRKTAIARATLYKNGTGKVKINGLLLDELEPEIIRLKIKEPLLLAPELAKKVDIEVNVKGGGIMAQAMAIRTAIGKLLVQLDESLKKVFQEYDVTILVADVRRKEPKKPGRHGRARARKQTSYR